MIHVVNPSLIVHPSDVSPSGASNRGGASVFLCVFFVCTETFRLTHLSPDPRPPEPLRNETGKEADHQWPWPVGVVERENLGGEAWRCGRLSRPCGSLM